ncbi:MAG: hypothetical protein ACYC5Q_05725 [Thermoleophilia bacterium]
MSTELEKIATLIHHWIEHNEGHRLSYLEWRDKLQDQDLPATIAALEEVAELSARANEALGRAVGELGASGGHSHLPGDHPHSH